MGIRIKVKQGHFNLLDDREVGYGITMWVGERYISHVLDREPMWTLPSHLIDAIEEDVSGRMFYSKRGKVLEDIAWFRQNQQALDTEWCDTLIAGHRDKIDAYEKLKLLIGEKYEETTKGR